jgi:urate oxidase
MVVKLLTHEHGKGRVRMLKVDRQLDRHHVIQLEAEILLEGPAERAYYNGDNGGVLPTDSVKNTVYVLAKKHEFESIEEFGVILAKHFLTTHPTIVRATLCDPRAHEQDSTDPFFCCIA